MKINTSRNAGFTLVEIMIVVAIIGLLAAIAIPNFVKARENAQLNSIFNNLRILEGAKDQWALENKKGTGDAVANVSTLSDYLKGGTIKAVVGETYTPQDIGTNSIAVLPNTISLGDDVCRPTPDHAPGGTHHETHRRRCRRGARPRAGRRRRSRRSRLRPRQLVEGAERRWRQVSPAGPDRLRAWLQVVGRRSRAIIGAPGSSPGDRGHRLGPGGAPRDS